ncbi:MAG: trehalase family glycosidase [Acidobacteriaceae bacterium]
MTQSLRTFRSRICTIALALAACTAAAAQPVSRTQSPQPINTYIRNTWHTLTRSMSDCNSLIDPKLHTTPVLYLPHDLPMPADVAAMQHRCKVRVLRLPDTITHFGQINPAQIKTPGLLYLPHPYVVPGGRFNEMYGWDSYFIIRGLLADHRVTLARGIVDNFFFEIQHYGGILNANRTYYFTRSQPPFLSSMIRAVYNAQVAEGHQQQALAWLARAYPCAQRDHSIWLLPVHRAGNTGLARYYDLGQGPVPEMADDSTYYPDVIRWLLDHPKTGIDAHPNYLIHAGLHPSAKERARLAQLSCNPARSRVCARAHVRGYWLTRSFYKGDRAMRESGFDTTFRFGPFGGSTQHYAPVGLNALLYKYESDLAWMATTLHKPAEAKHWQQQAATRRAAINRYLWNPQKKMYYDYNFKTHQQSGYLFLTAFYPLWVHAADPAQQQGVLAHIPDFDHPGGLAVSATRSGVQWDLPYGWAPTTFLAVQGMLAAGDHTDATRIANQFNSTVRHVYRQTGDIYEKYDVVNATKHFHVTAGYHQNVIGFGWTNAVYLQFEPLLHQPTP